MIYYLSQWGIYGYTTDAFKGPPFNWFTPTQSASGVVTKGDTYISGNFAGRFFALQDIVNLDSKFFAPSTKKIINFSFAGIDMNTCEVKTVDFFADFQVGVGGGCGEKGKYDWANASEGRYGHACQIKKLVTQGYEIRLSVGGWTMSTEFSHCTKENLDTLVGSLQWHKTAYGFTAFDFDWEYPGKQGCGGGGDDPCKFIVSRNLAAANQYLQSNSSPSTWSHPSSPNYGSNPSYFVPIATGASGSVDANNDNAEQCHSGDPGVPYRVCNDARLIADWTASYCANCPVSSTINNCVINNSQTCLKAPYQDCLNHYALAVTTHPDCSSISQIFQTKSGADAVTQYWATTGYDKQNDWANFVKLITKTKSQYSMPVTVALGMSTELLAGELSPDKMKTSWSEFCSAVDTINAMTYDYYGAWGPPYHNAPLFPNPSHVGKEGYLEKFDIDSSLRLLLDNGCTASKINLGLPLYGRTYANAAGKLGVFGTKGSQQTIGPGTYQRGSVSVWDAFARFFKSSDGGGGHCESDTDMQSAGIPTEMQHCGKWTYERDTIAGCVPWAWKANGSTFDVISYDDNISIALKAKYARCMGLNGLMFWDAADDKNAELSQVAWKAWNSVTQSECTSILKTPTTCDGSTTPPSSGDETPPSNDDQTPPVTGETGDCSSYKTCVDSCIDCITTGNC